ncbi:MAG: hypothetical protein CBD00_04445 [Rhodospirillaceae bacterium TMED140]|nr:hypothetical protein [Rhodospirillaceae bacterium]OUX69950.1 MAG: hypothetical protein CBD00_04445 [Rhodospirillaceae bacterium TMED140]
MAQRNTDHKCMKPGAWGRTSATLLIVLGLGLGLSGCSVLSMFSPFGDFGDDGKDVMLIEEGDLSRQTLGLSTTAVAVPTTNAAPLLAPGAAPAQSASALAAANAAANTAIGAAGAWRPSEELRDDVRRYLGQLGPKAFAVTKPMPGGAQAWAFVHGQGTASEVQRDALATCQLAAKEQSITNPCQLLFIDEDMKELGWP